MIAPEVHNVLIQWASRVVAQAKSNLLSKGKTATGELANSITFKIVPDPKSSIGVNVEFYYADYGDFVESGRKAYPSRGVNPNGEFVSALVKWIKIKGISQFRNKKGRYISTKSSAYLIARSINKRGIKPLPFFSDAVEKAQNDLYYELEEAVAQAFENDLIAIAELRTL